jgi:hypothetical protein
MEINLGLPRKVGNFLNISATLGISRTLFHGVSYMHLSKKKEPVNRFILRLRRLQPPNKLLCLLRRAKRARIINLKLEIKNFIPPSHSYNTSRQVITERKCSESDGFINNEKCLNDIKNKCKIIAVL